VEIPLALWDVDDYYDPDNIDAGKLYARHGAFIEGQDLFHPECFRIATVEAKAMDPHQRKALDVAYAAYQPGAHPPSSDGVVTVGQCCNDWLLIAGELGPFSGTGIAACISANRISFVFGLSGASLVVDTACSSSLVATEIGFKKLRQGPNAQALALGVHLMLAIGAYPSFCLAHMLSASGRCATFDASADGYLRGEGCGGVLLDAKSPPQHS
jgi:acyl transferase domain-containing protein